MSIYVGKSQIDKESWKGFETKLNDEHKIEILSIKIGHAHFSIVTYFRLIGQKRIEEEPGECTGFFYMDSNYPILYLNQQLQANYIDECNYLHLHQRELHYQV